MVFFAYTIAFTNKFHAIYITKDGRRGKGEKWRKRNAVVGVETEETKKRWMNRGRGEEAEEVRG